LKRHRALLWILISVSLAGCATENKKLARFDPEQGYRLRNLPPDGLNSDEIFIVLSFSGGGTRAAAFSFGAMEELAATPIGYGGTARHLLDEVDIISSISGGSFTSAYYGLYGNGLFQGDFERQFLRKSVQLGLALRVLNPVNWPRLASPYYDRIDLAADYYDALLFKGHSYHDLFAKGKRPFLVINATDMSLGSRFEFTQEQFDLLYSDLSSYPIARAVAASSAFPVLLSPLTLRNYGDRSDFIEPTWITMGLQDAEINARRFKIATIAQSYENASNRPYIHLLDGGTSDNVGLRGPARALLSTDGQDSILRLINLKKIKKLAIITVNSKPGSDTTWDRHKRAPGLLGVLSSVTSGPMDNYSLETIDSLKENIGQIVKDKQTEKAVIKRLKETCPAVNWPEVLPNVEFFDIELSFDKVKDPKVRQRLKTLPTNYHLGGKDIDLLKGAAREILRESDTFRRFVKSLE
jgi:NTE family protein